MQRHAPHLSRDIGIVALSVVIAVWLVRAGVIPELLASVSGFAVIGAFIAGMFFVSVFSAAPAAAVLIELFRANSLLEVALAGALGALVGDWAMFRFMRDHLAADLAFLARSSPLRRRLLIFRLKCFRWLTPLLGALIVASPLPDEIGLALMGLSRLRTVVFLPLSFALNFAGMLIIGFMIQAG